MTRSTWLSHFILARACLLPRRVALGSIRIISLSNILFLALSLFLWKGITIPALNLQPASATAQHSSLLVTTLNLKGNLVLTSVPMVL